MTTEQSAQTTGTANADAPAQGRSPIAWWHSSHPTFAALTGFFTGMLAVTALPGGFAAVLRLLFSYETAERYFPLVAIPLVVLPVAMLAKRKTRRFGIFMIVGMLLTALVVLGVASLVLYFMVQADS